MEDTFGTLVPNIFKLELPPPGVPLKCLNSYVVQEDRYMLVDAETPSDITLKFLKEGLESKLNLLEGTAITHLHVGAVK